jgi:hypothetical protein
VPSWPSLSFASLLAERVSSPSLVGNLATASADVAGHVPRSRHFSDWKMIFKLEPRKKSNLKIKAYLIASGVNYEKKTDKNAFALKEIFEVSIL